MAKVHNNPLFTNTVSYCDLCDNYTHWVWCDYCAEDVCTICHDAYPEDYCGNTE